MNNTKIFGLILAFVGQLLIVLLFTMILPEALFTGDPAIMWLDCAVISIIYWLWATNFLFSSLKLKDKAQKAIGGLGIRWAGTMIYTIAALIFMFIAFNYADTPDFISFKWQIMVQGILFFFLLIMMFATRTAMDKVGEVYVQEQVQKEGKKSVKESLQGLLFAMEDNHAPSEVIDRVRALSGEARFITPSTSDDARYLDKRIADGCYSITLSLPDYKMNEQKIIQLIHQLELDVARRKKAY